MPPTLFDAHINFTLAEAHWANAHLLSLEEAACHKLTFDSNSPISTFKVGNLVQVYDSASDFNYLAINKLKLAPKWSEPHIIYAELSNSFSLCSLTGIPFKGIIHSHHMCHYILL